MRERFRVEGLNCLICTLIFTFKDVGASFVTETPEGIFHADISDVLLRAKLLVNFECLELLRAHHQRLDGTSIEYHVIGPLLWCALMMSFVIDHQAVSSPGRLAVNLRNSGRLPKRV
jgi:hypothetical protein